MLNKFLMVFAVMTALFLPIAPLGQALTMQEIIAGQTGQVLAAAAASDNFNRTNQSPLAGNWTTANGFINLTNNSLIDNGLDDWTYWNAATFANDQFSQASVSHTTTEDNHAVAVRVAASGKTFYFCDGGAVHEIGKFVNGTHTSLKAVSVTINTNDVLRCEVQGTTIRYIVNGTVVNSVTDSSILSGSPGLFMSTSDGVFDDWSAGDLTSGGGGDTTAPSTPTNLSATAVSSSAINLSWSASTDNTGVTGYIIYRGGVQIATSVTNSYSDVGLTASTNYTYTVSAYDAASNNSPQSSTANATTQAAQSVGGTTRNVPCSGNITTALQAAIDASVDSDIVNIGAGNCTASQVGWTNKNIFVQGQGIGVTNVNGLAFDVVDTIKARFRITGMSVGAASAWKINAVDRTTGIKGWRIDHISWNYPACGQNIAIWVDGINWGLMDHNQFNNSGNAIFRRAWSDNTNEVNPWPPSGNPGMGGYSWLLPLNLGSDEALYMENNSFTMDNGCYYGVGDSFYGGRSVFRYNRVVNAYWQNHAARGFERGGNLKAEIYNNDFNATDSSWFRAIHIRSGTGVIFNNSLRGYFNTINVDNQRSDGENTDSPFGACNGSSAWDGNSPGQNGWPCLDQIGRASGAAYPNQTSQPLYAWNNGSSLGCSNGGSCSNDITIPSPGDPHVLAGRDYINNGTTPMPGYTPFPYPFPLDSNGLPSLNVNTGGSNPPSDPTPPAAPTGVRAN